MHFTRQAAIRAPIEKKVFASEVGQAFLAAAKAKGMDGDTRLREIIFIVMFAGYGGTGKTPAPAHASCRCCCPATPSFYPR